MKTISGKVVSTAPISLSRAAKELATFASFDNNGASDSISIYLKRASEAFNGLVQFHKDLQASHSTSRNHKNHRSNSKGVVKLEHEQNPTQFDEEKKNRNGKLEEVGIERNGGVVKVENGVKNEEKIEVEDGVKKRDKKKRKKSEGEEGVDSEEIGKSKMELVDVGNGVKNEEKIEVEDGMKKRDTKKRKKGEGEEGIDAEESEKSGMKGVDSAEQSVNRKRKKRKTEGKD